MILDYLQLVWRIHAGHIFVQEKSSVVEGNYQMDSHYRKEPHQTLNDDDFDNA